MVITLDLAVHAIDGKRIYAGGLVDDVQITGELVLITFDQLPKGKPFIQKLDFWGTQSTSVIADLGGIPLIMDKIAAQPALPRGTDPTAVYGQMLIPRLYWGEGQSSALQWWCSSSYPFEIPLELFDDFVVSDHLALFAPPVDDATAGGTYQAQLTLLYN